MFIMPDKIANKKANSYSSSDQTIHVLVVDDLRVNYLLVKAMLGKLNTQIYYTESGYKALEHIRNGNPTDIVLMDFNMPGMDGKETTELIKVLRPDLPVISLSTFTDNPAFDRSSAPYDAYITKPVNPELLIEMITTIIKK
ncbi:MAG: histidine kinase response regulator hybrid protein [Bacteroidetes bacterium]|nr:MAG: histidine kinase response regulator hybrid protein [Bacteroidota bacterium]